MIRFLSWIEMRLTAFAGLLILGLSTWLAILLLMTGQEVPVLALLLAASWWALSVIASVPLVIHGLWRGRFHARREATANRIDLIESKEGKPRSLGGHVVSALSIFLLGTLSALSGIWLQYLLGEWAVLPLAAALLLILRSLFKGEAWGFALFTATLALPVGLSLSIGDFISASLVLAGVIGLLAGAIISTRPSINPLRHAWRFFGAVREFAVDVGRIERKVRQTVLNEHRARENQAAVIGVSLILYGLAPGLLVLSPPSVDVWITAYDGFARGSLPYLPFMAFGFYALLTGFDAIFSLQEVLDADRVKEGSLSSNLMGLQGPFGALLLLSGPSLLMLAILLQIADSSLDQLIALFLGFFVFPSILVRSSSYAVSFALLGVFGRGKG